ncbi:zinc finger and BTB domain-containing protein 41-like [Colletes gigas]|uniref:zinc finger and BTB domain-containing protein 41-like n=1 Tax=Colletes gigas TaxID=935657 RepID=UPI001C9AF97D|nr:zinc finger and BTB domain-containing protein 41-like [Colletes gigas]
MLTLENMESKDFSKSTMEDEETSKERNSKDSYEKDKYPVTNKHMLQTDLLSTEVDDNTDIESQQDNPSELLSIENNSKTSSEATISDWEDIEPKSPLSYVPSTPNKEFIIITHLESDEEFITDEVPAAHSFSNKKAKSRHRSKRRNKVLFLRKLLPKHEPIIEIKEEEHSIISTNEHTSTIEEINYEESSINEEDIADFEDVRWLPIFRTLPLFYTEEGKPYLKCSACGAVFFTSNSFQTHLHTHMYQDEDSFVCSFCNYTNTEPGMLFNHLSKHQNQCEFCNQNLLLKHNFEKHWKAQGSNFSVKRDHQGRFICSLCKLVFDSLPQLEKHWLKHACNRERTYQCKECSGLYDSIETLNNHKCMMCPVCGKFYDSLHRLKTHTVWAKHTLKCPICSYDFILAIDHEKHVALHRQTYISVEDHLHCLQAADGKTFQCNLCDKIFYALPSLVLHLETDHDIKNVKTNDEEEEVGSINEIGLEV